MADDDMDIDLGDIIAAALDSAHDLTDTEIEALDQALECSGMPPEQRREWVQAIWTLIVAFIDFEWRHHPVQHVQNPCGKPPKTVSGRPLAARSVLDLDTKTPTATFEKAACETPPERVP